MGTTYQAPNLSAQYGSTHTSSLPGYASSLARADRARATLSDAQAALYASSRHQPYAQPQSHQIQPQQQHSRYSNNYSYPQPQLHVPSQERDTALALSVIPQQAVSSRHSTRPSTPTSNHSTASQTERGLSRRDSAAMVLYSLQIPSCISPVGGDLADFAAQLTTLFWFESSGVLTTAESLQIEGSPSPTPRLADKAIPQPNFKRWTSSILSTTQVTQNVIFLALLFIHRLKTTNPGVKGRSGSEYRLLTVALMLGNKFLDDNTYTNKTWAEVSGISVQEIHVMEVEFLSNMRYSLFVSKEEWEGWLMKLSKFWQYCERARAAPPSPAAVPSPTNQRMFASPLPSPAGPLQLSPSEPTTSSAFPLYSPCPAGNPVSNHQIWMNSGDAANPISPLEVQHEQRNFYGKRPFMDEDVVEPHPKRMSRLPQPLPSQSLPQNHAGTRHPAMTAEQHVPRLSVPHLTLNTTATVPVASSQAYTTPTTYAPQPQGGLSLPPLVPGTRAMSTVFPPTASTYLPQLPVLTTSGPTMAPASITTPTTAPPVGSAYAAYGTPTKRLSPVSALTPAQIATAFASSPLVENLSHSLTGPISGVHTPVSHSPSIYLQQRPSPYRPIRHVNTLLYPPPSASLQEYHLSGAAIPPTQMHYQPLGRRNEYRTGILPEFQQVVGTQLFFNNSNNNHSNMLRTGQQSLKPGQIIIQGHNQHPSQVYYSGPGGSQ